MKYRRLGKSGPQVSAVSHGRGSQPVVRSGEPLEVDFNATIRRVLDLGINFFDSSDAYWDTRHEVLLGRALEGRRGEALVASKFGNIDLGLSEADVQRLSEIFAIGAGAGPRYGENVLKGVGL